MATLGSPTGGALTAANAATGDKFPVVDVSDGASDSANKYMLVSELRNLVKVRPTIVRAEGFVQDSGSVTLSTTPTPGNLLVALGTHYSNGTVPNTGWTQLLMVNGSGYDGPIIATKTVTAADTTSIAPWGGVTGSNIVIYEIADGRLDMAAISWFMETTTTAKTFQLGAQSDNSLLIGSFCVYSSSSTPTITGGPTTGTSVTGTATNASPRRVTPFYQNVDKGSATAVATYSGSVVQTGTALVIAPQ